MNQFGKLVTLLSLAEDADEEIVLGTIQKLLNEVESARTLLTAEREARTATTKALEERNAELQAIRAARHEAALAEILQGAVRRGALVPKTVLGEDGKPRRVEGPAEAAIRDMARNLGIEAARDYADSLPSQNVPIGPSITEGTSRGARKAIAAPAGGSILRMLGLNMDDVQKFGRLDRVSADLDEDKE